MDWIKENMLRTRGSNLNVSRAELSDFVVKEGWLMKRDDNLFTQKWRNQWFVLCQGFLYRFDGPEDHTCKDMIPLSGAAAWDASPGLKDQFSKTNGVFAVGHSSLRTYFVSARDRDMNEDWLSCLQEQMCLLDKPIDKELYKTQGPPDGPRPDCTKFVNWDRVDTIKNKTKSIHARKRVPVMLALLAAMHPNLSSGGKEVPGMDEVDDFPARGGSTAQRGRAGSEVGIGMSPKSTRSKGRTTAGKSGSSTSRHTPAKKSSFKAKSRQPNPFSDSDDSDDSEVSDKGGSSRTSKKGAATTRSSKPLSSDDDEDGGDDWLEKRWKTPRTTEKTRKQPAKQPAKRPVQRRQSLPDDNPFGAAGNGRTARRGSGSKPNPFGAGLDDDLLRVTDARDLETDLSRVQHHLRNYTQDRPQGHYGHQRALPPADPFSDDPFGLPTAPPSHDPFGRPSKRLDDSDDDFNPFA